MAGEGLEAVVAPALVRLTNADDATLGTGFVAGPGGLILTCHHVVAGRERVSVQFADGEGQPTALALEPDWLLPDLDLAILRVPGCNVKPLPLASEGERSPRFWTKGFQWEGRGLLDAFPVEGRITGETDATYPGAECDYTLRRALALAPEGGGIDPGMSGGPLLDPASGAVCGVVVARIGDTGSALAQFFAHAAHLDPRLQGLIDLNNGSVPRFGRYLNALGARVICRAQLERAVRQLGHLYLADRYCSREGIAESLEAFKLDAAPVLPIAGLAGVGKTNTLARLAEDMAEQDQCVLLLRGLHLNDTTTSLDDLVTRALRDADEAPWRERPTSADLVAALERSGERLWLLLDGLNEARAPLRDLIDLWAPEASAWLRGRAVKLVLTCRVEQWQLLAGGFPRELLFSRESAASPAASGAPALRLEDFSADEAERAGRSYGVDVSEGMEFLHHPLTLRLVWELQSGAGAGAPAERLPDVGAVIDRFIDRACSRVAARVAPAPSGKVRGVVDTLARRMYDERDYEVSFAAAGALRGSDAASLDLLTDEHLFNATPTGYRFAFDEVSDYLQSTHVNTAELARLGDLLADCRERPAVPLPVLVHAYGRLAAAGPEGALEAAIYGLCSWLEQEKRSEGLFFGFQVARRIASCRAAPGLIEKLVASCAVVDGEDAAWLFAGNAERLALPPPAALRLVRRLLPAGEHWHGWRLKDWQDPNRRRAGSAVFARHHSLARPVGIALQADRSLTLRTLATWMDDETPLATGSSAISEARIGDFAVACLFYARDRGMKCIAEFIAEVRSQRAGPLLQIFAEEKPAVMAETVSAWVGKTGRQEIAAEVLIHIYHKVPEFRRQAVPPLIRLAAEAENPKIRHAAQGVLAYEPGWQEAMWTRLRDAYLAGEPGVSAWSFHPFLKTRFDEIVDVLRYRLRAWSPAGPDDYIGRSAAAFLGEYARNLHQVRRTVEFLNEMLPKTGMSSIALTLENILYRADLATARSSGALDLAGALLERDPEEAACLLYVAFPSGEDYAASATLRDVVGRIDAKPMLGRIMALVAEGIPKRGAEAWSWLQPLRKAATRDEWERRLLGRVWLEGGALAKFVEDEWRSVPRADTGPVSRAYLTARDRGASPRDAARSVIDELR